MSPQRLRSSRPMEQSALDPRRACGLGLLTALLACTAHPQIEVARTSPRALAPSFTEANACSPAAPTETCSGPWLFQRYVRPCYALRADPDRCGTRSQLEVVYVNPSCLHVAPGTQTPITATGEYDWFFAKHRCGGGVIVGTLSDPDAPKKACDAALQKAVAAQLHGNLAQTSIVQTAIVPSGQTTDDGSISGCDVTYEHDFYRCTATLVGATDSADPSCGPPYGKLVPVQVPRECRDPSFGEAIGACGTAPDVLFSDWGQTSDQAAAGDPYRAPGPSCATESNRPASTPEAARGKASDLMRRYRCLGGYTSDCEAGWTAWISAAANRDAAASPAALARRIGDELRDLYETQGQDLPAAARADLRALYADLPPAGLPNCGVALDADATGAELHAWAARVGALGDLLACRRLLSTHVAADLLALEIPVCLDLLTEVDAGRDAAAFAELAALARALVDRSLDQLAASHPDGGAFARAALAALAGWYRAARTVRTIQPAPADDVGDGAETLGIRPIEQVEVDLRRMVYDVERRILDQAQPMPALAAGATSDATFQTVAALAGAESAADRAVILAAFSADPPLRTGPLILVLGDAIGRLTTKLERSARDYDLAARFLGAGGGASETARLTELVGLLGDPARLGAALDRAPRATLSSEAAAWLDAFAAISAQLDVLQDAYADLAGDPAAVLPGVGPSPGGSATPARPEPAQAGPLLGAIRRARALSDQVQATGFFDPGRLGTLATALPVQEQRDALLRDLDASTATLRNILAQFDADRAAALGRLVEEIQDDAGHAETESREADLLAEITRLNRRLGALRNLESAASDGRGRFLDAFTRQMQNPSWPAGLTVQRSTFALAFAATEARAALGQFATAALVPELAVRGPDGRTPWSLDVQPGDLLDLGVQGRWAPTCALRSEAAPPFGPAIQSDAVLLHALTGPEGYEYVFSSGTASIHSLSHAEEDFETSTMTINACGSGAIEVTSFLKIGLNLSSCEAAQLGHRSSTTETNTNEESGRMSAQYAGGLRVPEAPFPMYPAGSLLLVELAPDGQRIHDVTVVGRRAGVVAHRAARLYLVVNDVTGCAGVDRSALSVAGTLARPVDGARDPALLELGRAMAAVLGDLDLEYPRHQGEGYLTPLEVEALRTRALASLESGCGCTLSSYPEPLLALFTSWLAGALASLERRVAIDQTIADIAVKTGELSGYHQGLAALRAERSVLELVKRWALERLSTAEVDERGEDLTATLEATIHPMMQLQYPAALDRLRSSQVLTELRDLPWSSPRDLFVAKELAAAGIIAEALRSAQGPENSRVHLIALAFPKPDAPVGLDVDFGAPPSAGLLEADPRRLPGVYAGGPPYVLRPQAAFEVTPEDLYRPGVLSMLCTEAVPIIRSMAIYAVASCPSGCPGNGTDLVPFTAQATGTYPHESGLLAFVTADHAALSGGVPLIAGPEEQLFDNYQRYARAARAGAGLTPFTTFALDFGSRATDPNNLISRANRLILILEIEARGVAPGQLTGIHACPKGL